MDEYVRVTNPSVWVVLATCATLLVGLYAWDILGTAETSVSVYATRVKGETVCFLSAEKASTVHVGDSANVDGKLMEVESLSDVPLSRAEVQEIVGNDYLVSTLMEGDWTYLVRFAGDDGQVLKEGVPLPTRVTVERIAPITVVFKGAT